MARIMLGDETDLTLMGARAALAEHPTYEIIGCFVKLDDLLAGLHVARADVVIFSERLDPDCDAFTLVERLKIAAPTARLVVMGNLMDGLLLHDLFACGMSGYLFKADPLQECLVYALNAVTKNRPYLSPTANSEYLVAMQSPLRQFRLDSEALAVLRLLAQGEPAGQIAVQMNVPLRRVYRIRSRLRRRFGATTNEHLISRALAEHFTNLRD